MIRVCTAAPALGPGASPLRRSGLAFSLFVGIAIEYQHSVNSIDNQCHGEYAVYIYDGSFTSYFHHHRYTSACDDPQEAPPSSITRSSTSSIPSIIKISVNKKKKTSSSCEDDARDDHQATDEDECSLGCEHTINQDIVEFLREYQIKHHCKFIVAGLTSRYRDRHINHNKQQQQQQQQQPEASLYALGKSLWFALDILPCYVMDVRYTNDPNNHDSLTESACSAARKMNRMISSPWMLSSSIAGARLSSVMMTANHEVLIDSNYATCFTDLNEYRKFITEPTWKQILAAAEMRKKQNKKIVFIGSTAQGGGVALMRHSTLRFCHLLGIQAHWFVMKPNPHVYEITKKKFHNVLQSINHVQMEEERLTEKDKQLWQHWCESNFTNYFATSSSEHPESDTHNDADPDILSPSNALSSSSSPPPSPLLNADVYVFDDPQPSGMIPLFASRFPRSKLVYRSHIEIRSDFIRDTDSQQHRVWQYLWENIRLCHLFISHPVESFIPDNVRENTSMKVMQFPASTDPCDGLNKHLDEFSLRYYHCLFNRIALDQTEKIVDFKRPYFVQVSRFDPSKGIPDLINAYVKFRKRLEIAICENKNTVPQLIITGHGSIDDPQGQVIYDEIIQQIDDIEDKEISADIHAVFLGPSDQMLNAMMSGAHCAFQLSHREGFEVKVSEALLKGIPIIAYKAGGIPLQIRDKEDGYLCNVGDVEAVSELMLKLVTDQGERERLSKNALQVNREQVLTPVNVLHWLRIMAD